MQNQTNQSTASDAPTCSASLMLTADEAKLLRHGICSFDSACSGVSHEERAECADAVVSLVEDSLRKANAPQLDPQQNACGEAREALPPTIGSVS